MAVQSKTKEKIIDAAVSLFNVKGFDGTSVREIAGKAKVNVANISYYFHSKEGLLESLVISYFEGYIAGTGASIPRNEKAVFNRKYDRDDSSYLTLPARK